MAYKTRRTTRPKRRLRRARKAHTYKALYKKRIPRTYYYTRWVGYGQSTVGNRPGGQLTFDLDRQAVFTLSNVAGSTSYGTLSLDFQVQDIPTLNDFGALYDKYKLAFVKVKIIPYATSAQTGAAFTSVYGQSAVMVHSILDTDDNVIPTASANGVDILREYQTYKVKNLLSSSLGVTRVIRPRILTAVNDSTGLNVGSKISSGWLNLQNVGVPHFGMKFIFEGVSGGSSDPVNGQKIMMKIEAKFYLIMREVR